MSKTVGCHMNLNLIKKCALALNSTQTCEFIPHLLTFPHSEEKEIWINFFSGETFKIILKNVTKKIK